MSTFSFASRCPMQSNAATPAEYVQSLPEDRREIIEQIRQTLLDNLPKGIEEAMSYGMLAYVVPLSLYPEGYHCKPGEPLPLIHLASQKNYICLYHMGLYDGTLLDWLREAWPRHSDKKLDLGKCCLRFKKPQDVPLKLIGQLARKLTVKQWIAKYEQNKPRK